MRNGTAGAQAPTPPGSASRPGRSVPSVSVPLTRRALRGLAFAALLPASLPLGRARATPLPELAAEIEHGIASYYARHWSGRRTASGDTFDPAALTAAHNWLPFGTEVRVACAATGREVVVSITDRLGTDRRVIDLSHEAARRLGILSAGVTMVTLSYA